MARSRDGRHVILTDTKCDTAAVGAEGTWGFTDVPDGTRLAPVATISSLQAEACAPNRVPHLQRACFGRRALPHPPAPRERRRRAPARTREQRLARPGPRPPRTHALKKDGKREKEKGRRKAGSWKLKTNDIHTTPGPRA